MKIPDLKYGKRSWCYSLCTSFFCISISLHIHSTLQHPAGPDRERFLVELTEMRWLFEGAHSTPGFHTKKTEDPATLSFR